MRVADYLQQRGAHHDVVVWATRYESDFAAAYAECPRGDWLLAVAVRAGVPAAPCLLAAAACARLGLSWLDEPQQADAALARLERVAQGNASADGLGELRNALEGLELPDPASATALSAVVLALSSATDLESAALVPSAVVQAAMFAVADCGVMSLLRHTQQETADAVRAHIPFALVAAACNSQSDSSSA
jgi:hypothetical protein